MNTIQNFNHKNYDISKKLSSPSLSSNLQIHLSPSQVKTIVYQLSGLEKGKTPHQLKSSANEVLNDLAVILDSTPQTSSQGNLKNMADPTPQASSLNSRKRTQPAVFAVIHKIFHFAGLKAPTALPDKNPVTGAEIDWNKSINEKMSQFFIDQTNRRMTNERNEKTEQETDKLMELLLTVLSMGNIDLAMLLFSTVESKQATQITQKLTQRLIDAQEKRRGIAEKIGNMKEDKSGEITKQQNALQEVGDSIQLLTSFIRDVNDQKNRTIEFTNNFLSSEHQTTMSLVRKG